ncbi:Uncharacterized protein OBRU01_07132, partial [Operophtera brumata]
TCRTRDEFLRVLEETPSLSIKTRKSKTALGIYLAKIRTGEADDRLCSIFHMTRQNVERLLNISRQCLNEDFVPIHLAKVESYGYVAIMPEIKTRTATQLTTMQGNKSRMCTICRWPVEVVNGRFKRDFRTFRHTYFNKSMLHMYEDFRIAAALTNAFHIPLFTPNHLAEYVEARSLNRHRIEFNNISGHLPHLPHFPVLTEDELILFSVGTYQLKLAASYYSEHIRGGDYIIEIYANNDDIPDLNNFDLPTTNIWLLRSRIRSRHSRSKTYFCYLLVDENLRGIESISRRTIGVCAHTVTVVWFLAYARHKDTIN